MLVADLDGRFAVERLADQLSTLADAVIAVADLAVHLRQEGLAVDDLLRHVEEHIPDLGVIELLHCNSIPFL